VPPAPHQPTALLVLREGSVNGVYYATGGLSHYGGKLEDFDYLLDRMAKLFPPGVKVSFDVGSHGPANDVTLNQALVKNHHPDTLVIMTLGLHSGSKGFIYYTNQLQVEVQVDFVDPATLEVRATKTLQSQPVKSGSFSRSLPPKLKEQLTEQFAKEFPALPE
jgi:hypothetical protein